MHVVYATVVVPGIYTLFIEPGAIVKFLTGTGIDISQGGALFANKIVFTHINDDTVGGDTLADGYTVAPPMDAYTLSGNFTFGDDTELRGITQNNALTGTISTRKVLSRGSTYRVSGTLTIANGGSLTIPPGPVLKMEDKAAIVVNSGATLSAVGTRAAPIIITSIKDDSVSGDTNGDGDKTIPQPGDWEEIKNNGGVINLAFVSALYGGYGQYSNQGDAIIRTASGTTTMDCCVVMHSNLRLIGRTGGTVTAENCILQDGRWGIDGVVTFVNGVIADCNTGANGATVRNSILWECDTYASGGAISDCVCWSLGGSRPQSIAFNEASGNIWGDPLFVDPDNGDFRIQEGSPCVDAADSSVAPEFDYYGQPRITVTEQGTNTVGQLADIGICELMPRNVTSDIDLVPQNVRTVTNAVPGELLFVKWEVKNAGGNELEGAWRDTVSLVSNNGREIQLGVKTTTGVIAPGGSIFCSGYFTVPPISEGEWYPKVNVNSYRDVFEGALGVNNALVGDRALIVMAEALDPSVAREGVIGGGTPSVIKLTFGADDENRMVKFDVPAGVKVTWGFGFMPQGASQSGSMTAADGGVMFRVPEGATDVYVVLESDKTVTYEMTTESTKMVITGVTPNTLPSSGTTTLVITGAGFGETNAVLLSTATDSIRLQSIAKDASGNLIATVDCAQLNAGQVYDVKVESGDKLAELARAVNISKVECKGVREARLILPETARQGRIGVGYIEYANVGTGDMLAPIFKIKGDMSSTLVSIGSSVNEMTESIRLVGVGDKYPAGVINPGCKNRLPFFFMVKGSFRLELSVVDSSSDEQRNSIYKTWDEFTEAISQAATELNRFGVSSDYDEIYSVAMRAGVGDFVTKLKGRVCDARTGEPFSDIDVKISDTNNVLIANLRTDATGCFEISKLKSGEIYVVSSKECQLYEKWSAANSRLGEVVFLANPRGGIKCSVNGCVHTDVTVTAVNLLTEGIYAAVQDGEGFVISNLVDGEYEIHTQINGFYSLTNNYMVAVVDGVCTNGLVSLDFVPSGVVAGSFTDSEGDALSNIRCFVRNTMTDIVFEFVSDSAGKVMINVPAGEYELSVENDYSLSEQYIFEVVENVLADHNFKLDRSPFVISPAMGFAPLKCALEFTLATNAFTQSFSCEWDFDGDGMVDSTDLAPVWTYNSAGMQNISGVLTFADGRKLRISRKKAVEVLDDQVEELAEGTVKLDEQSGWSIVESGDGYYIVKPNWTSVPLYLDKGVKIIDPALPLVPVEILSLEMIGGEEVVLNVKPISVNVAYSKLKATYPITLMSTGSSVPKGGNAKASIKSEISYKNEPIEVTGGAKVEGEVCLILRDGKLEKFNVSLDAELSAKIALTGKKGFNKQYVIPGTDNVFPVGMIPVSWNMYIFAKGSVEGGGLCTMYSILLCGIRLYEGERKIFNFKL